MRGAGGGIRWILLGVLVAGGGVGLLAMRERPESSGSSGAGDRWRRELPHGSASELVVADEVVCTTSSPELLCLEAASGKEVFSVDLPRRGVLPALAGETIVVVVDGDDGGELYGYSLDGEQLWKTSDLRLAFDPLLDRHEGLPVAGTVVAVPQGRGTVAIDARSGEELWTLDESVAFDLASDGERFYGDSLEEEGFRWRAGVVAFEPSTGEELWTVPTAEGSNSEGSGASAREAVAFGDGLVGLSIVVQQGDGEEELVVVDRATGEVAWRRQVGDDTDLDSVDGALVVADGLDVTALDPTGAELWKSHLPPAGSDFPDNSAHIGATPDGRIFAITTDVFLLDPTTHQPTPVIQDLNPHRVVVADGYAILSTYEDLTSALIGIPTPT